jgi:hypothetical protein
MRRASRHAKQGTESNMSTETKADYEIAREELNEAFAFLKLPVVISSPMGVVSDEWPCIRYSVGIGGEFFEYSLGIGHVDFKDARAVALGDKGARVHPFTREDVYFLNSLAAGKTPIDKKYTATLAAKVANYQKKQPNPAEVLASVCREGLDADESFESWCGNFGYEEDSRKAEAIYRQCTDNGKKARRLLSPANFAKFADLSARL